MNLPLLAVEQAGVFYANSRLSVTIWGCHLWSADLPSKGVFFTVATRILEKSAKLAVVLLEVAIKRFRQPHQTHIVLWSDTGPHFRAKVAISTFTFPILWNQRCSGEWNFWVEMHGKSCIDGYVGLLSQISD
jgi:hypothetical protein